MTDPGPTDTPRKVWRNPYLWAALTGMITVTLLRPLMRHVPEPPPIGASVPAVALTDHEGRPFDGRSLLGKPWVIGFVDAGCTGCGTTWSALAALGRRMWQAGGDVPVVAVSVASDSMDAMFRHSVRAGLQRGDVLLVTGPIDEVCALARLAFAGEPGAVPSCDRLGEVARASRLAIVDPEGRLRGLYGTDVLGQDEVFHRCLDLAQEAERARARNSRGGGS